MKRYMLFADTFSIPGDKGCRGMFDFVSDFESEQDATDFLEQESVTQYSGKWPGVRKNSWWHILDKWTDEIVRTQDGKLGRSIHKLIRTIHVDMPPPKAG